MFVEMRVLLESETSFVLEAAEVPKNFLYIRCWTKHLCHESVKLESDRMGSRTRHLRFTMVGHLSGKDLRRRNSTTVVGSRCSSSVALRQLLALFGVEL